jgi:anthranilate phosphoribosyltransferase
VLASCYHRSVSEAIAEAFSELGEVAHVIVGDVGREFSLKGDNATVRSPNNGINFEVFHACSAYPSSDRRLVNSATD